MGKALGIIRRVATGLLAVVAAALLILSGGLLYLRTEGGAARLRAAILPKLQERVPGLDIGRIGGNLTRDIVLDDVRVRDEDGGDAVYVKRIELRMNLLALASHKLDVERLALTAPTVHVSRRPDGSLNLAHLVLPRQTPPTPSKLVVHVQAASLREGTIDADMVWGADSASVRGLTADAALDQHGDALHVQLDELAANVVAGDRSGRVTWHGLLANIDHASDAPRVDVALGQIMAHGFIPGAKVIVTGSAQGPLTSVACALEARQDDGARVTLHGDVGAFAGAVHYALEARVAHLDPALFIASLKAGRMSAALHVHGRGVPMARHAHATVTLEMAPSLVQGIAVSELRASATLDGGAWSLEQGYVRVPFGQAWLSGHGEGQRVALDIAADLTGRLPRSLPDAVRVARGAGHFEAHVSGELPSALAVRVQGKARDVAVAETRIGGVAIDAAFDGLPQKPRGQAHAVVTGLRPAPGQSPIERAELTARGDGRDITVKADVQGDRVHGHAELAAHITPSEISVQVSALHARAGEHGVAITAPTFVRVRPDREVSLAPTHLALYGGAATVSGTYRWKPARNQPVLEAALDARGIRPLPTTTVDGALQARASQTELTFLLDAKLNGHAPAHIDARIPLRTPRGGGAPALARSGPVALHLLLDQLGAADVPSSLRDAERLTNGQLSVHANVSGDIARPKLAAEVDVHGLEARAIRQGDLHAAVTIEDSARGAAQLSMGGRRVLELSGHAAVGTAAWLEHRVPADPEIGANLVIPGFDLTALIGILQQFDHSGDIVTARIRREGVSGVLKGQAQLTGTVHHPHGRADLHLDGARSGQLVFGAFSISARYDGRELVADFDAEQLTQPQGGSAKGHTQATASEGTLRGRIKIPLPFTESAQIDVQMEAKHFDLSFLRMLLPQVRELGGKLDAHLWARGSAGAPELGGSLALADGRLGVAGQRTLENITLSAQVQPGKITLSHLQARSGDGAVSAEGTITLAGLVPTQAEMTAHARKFIINAGEVTGARLEGDFRLTARNQDGALQAHVDVSHGVVSVPQIGGARKLQSTAKLEDVRFVDAAARAAARRSASKQQVSGTTQKVDVRATAERFAVRGKEIDADFATQLEVRTDEAGQMALYGEVTALSGHLTLFGRDWDLDRVHVSFDGEPEPDPGIEVRLTRQFTDATVTIAVTGTLKKPTLTLTADPPLYDQAQIVSLILTGDTGGQPGTGGSFSPVGAISGLVLGQIAGKIAPHLPVDVLKVDVNKEDQPGVATGTETSVEVGKHVTDRIYLSYTHVFGANTDQNSNEAHVEYKVTRRWLLETVFGDAGVGGIDMYWTYRY
jgi:autotransporter translocation and assembly factor TamB